MKKILCIFKKNRDQMYQSALDGKASATAFFGLLPFFRGDYREFTAKMASEETFRIANAIKLLRHIFWADIIIASKFSNLFVFAKILFFWKTFVVYNINLRNVIIRSERSWLRRRYISFKLRFADLIVCISHDQELKLESIGVPKRKILFMPFGVDTKYLKNLASSSEPSKSDPFFLIVGADVERDFPTLLGVINALPDRQFVLVTNGQNAFIPQLKQKNITIHVGMSLEKLVDLYKKAEATLVVTLNEHSATGSDCSGQTVILDVLSLGLPVITTRRSWMQDYFPDLSQVPMTVLSPEDPEAIARVIKDGAWRKMPGSSHNYTVDQMTEFWKELFNFSRTESI